VLILLEDRSASPGPVGLCGYIDRADLCGDPAYPQFRWQCAVFVAIWSFCWWRSWWRRSVPCWEPSEKIILVSNSSATIFIARWSTAFWGLWLISEYIPYIMIFPARIIIFYVNISIFPILFESSLLRVFEDAFLITPMLRWTFWEHISPCGI